jgi:hypothetical protein
MMSNNPPSEVAPVAIVPLMRAAGSKSVRTTPIRAAAAIKSASAARRSGRRRSTSAGWHRDRLRFGFGQRFVRPARRLSDQRCDGIGPGDEIAFEKRDRRGGLRPLRPRLLDIQTGDQPCLIAPARELEIVLLKH